MQGQMQIFHVGLMSFGESLQELLQELWLSCIAQPKGRRRTKNTTQ